MLIAHLSIHLYDNSSPRSPWPRPSLACSSSLTIPRLLLLPIVHSLVSETLHPRLSRSLPLLGAFQSSKQQWTAQTRQRGPPSTRCPTTTTIMTRPPATAPLPSASSPRLRSLTSTVLLDPPAPTRASTRLTRAATPSWTMPPAFRLQTRRTCRLPAVRVAHLSAHGRLRRECPTTPALLPRTSRMSRRT
jgi:hypothetical protein